jgi:uncharacterized protein
MNILFSTGHPAQIHNFKLVKQELEQKGHRVFWLATGKDISKYLLQHYCIDYILIKKPGKSFFSKAQVLLFNTIKCLNFIRKNKIDVIVSRVSPYLSLAGFLLRKPHFALADTESSGIYNKAFAWFVSTIITAQSFQKTLRRDQVRFNGNIELFYLHPNRFEPDEGIFDLLGVEKDEPYVIMRFVSWDAYHDKGLSGFTDGNKIKAVKEFSRYARVFISAEKKLPSELEPYKIKIPPEKMHDALAFASLFFGESATMASESAVLGTPAIYMDKIGRGYTDEEEKHGLVFNFKDPAYDQERAIARGAKLLADPGGKEAMRENRRIFLENKIDPTTFLVWFIEYYPQSFQVMRQNPGHQYSFK